MTVHSEFFLKALTTVSLLYSTYKISYITFSEAMKLVWLPVIQIEASDNEDSDNEDSDDEDSNLNN